MQVGRRITQMLSNWLRWDETPTTPVLLLGSEYTPEETDKFLVDLSSRIWLSYRKNFAPIQTAESTVESDQGWGCMMRVTQMMLAQCSVTHRLSRAWRFEQERDMAEDSVYMDICRRFFDKPEARLSLHNFVARGTDVLGKKPSTWFGPTSGAQVGEALVNAETPDGLRACCFTDGVLYRTPVLDALSTDGCSAVVVFLCRKLGVDSFNAERYRAPIKACFASPQFMGLCGGGPMTSAYYFVAATDKGLYYLDPHYETREAFLKDEEAAGLHAARPLHLVWEALNPSMCLGFLVRSAEELDELASFLVTTDPDVFEVLDTKVVYNAQERVVVEEEEFMVLE